MDERHCNDVISSIIRYVYAQQCNHSPQLLLYYMYITLLLSRKKRNMRPPSDGPTPTVYIA